ncbi:MAG: FkbM family methyltransferase [Chloracidobacterium sp.]|uniref:FkbM family methyltransferase n=1 Tax=Chloracidobacterium validum TaxID=2821543 RepID=A0ABX8B912_9BACT|nr:FkbM family methyltransferase [Chloracidobacterium validum]QUW03378.1 FkbM family methyltransferase [Chloracidobacterium validum]
MKHFVRQLLEKAGYLVFRTAYAPKQIDVTLDIRRLVPPESINVIYDVGANVGQTVTWFRRAFPQAHIVAFEPIKATFSQLQANVGQLPNVTLFNLALGASPGTAVVHLQASSGHNSLNPVVNHATSAGASEMVRIETLAAVTRQLGFSRIDLLKIDTEGYELAVLAGATDFLPKLTFVYAEIDFEPAGRHTNFFALYELLAGYGFNFFGLYDMYHYDDGRLNFANALFVNPKLIGSNTTHQAEPS